MVIKNSNFVADFMISKKLLNFWLCGSAHARDRDPHQFFGRRSKMQNVRRRNPRRGSGRAGQYPDKNAIPPRAKKRGSKAGHAIGGRGNLFEACYNDSTFSKMMTKLR